MNKRNYMQNTKVQTLDKPNLYLFLDCDGVLNNVYTFQRQTELNWPLNHYWLDLDKKCVANLLKLENFLKDKYNVHLILSSTWRMLPQKKKDLNRVFWEEGLLLIEDCTPDNHTYRGIEIQEYMDAHRIKKEQILILDDEDTGHLNERLVKTDFYGNGLDEQAVIKALELVGIEVKKLWNQL